MKKLFLAIFMIPILIFADKPTKVVTFEKDGFIFKALFTKNVLTISNTSNSMNNFRNNWKTSIDFGYDAKIVDVNKIGITNNGKIFVVFYSYQNNKMFRTFVRINPSGELDQTLNRNSGMSFQLIKSN